jgi:dihydrofolate reductase
VTISLVVAVAENGVIGRANALPWRLSADLRRFKELTMGHTVIMGRKTFESIGKGLTGRRNLVVSRNPEFRPEGATRVPSLEAAFEAAGPTGEVFVIGGSDIYRQAMPLAEKIFLTLVHAAPEGDAHFPLPDSAQWALVSTELHGADDRNEFATEFRVYQRREKEKRDLRT